MIEIIVTVDGIGYKGVFDETMTQKEIIAQIKYAFKQLKLFPKENKDIVFEKVVPKEENLEVLDQVKVL